MAIFLGAGLLGLFVWWIFRTIYYHRGRNERARERLNAPAWFLPFVEAIFANRRARTASRAERRAKGRHNGRHL
jgi:hypothetical protein